MGYVILSWHSLSLPYNYFDICNNVNLDPEMCLRREEDVKLQTGVAQTKLNNLKSRVGGPDPQFPHWIRACRGFGKKVGL